MYSSSKPIVILENRSLQNMNSRIYTVNLGMGKKRVLQCARLSVWMRGRLCLLLLLLLLLGDLFDLLHMFLGCCDVKGFLGV